MIVEVLGISPFATLLVASLLPSTNELYHPLARGAAGPRAFSRNYRRSRAARKLQNSRQAEGVSFDRKKAAGGIFAKDRAVAGQGAGLRFPLDSTVKHHVQCGVPLAKRPAQR